MRSGSTMALSTLHSGLASVVMVARFSKFVLIAITALFITGLSVDVFAQPSEVGSSAPGFPTTINKTGSQFRIARLKYAGGSDWYNGPSEEPNLLRFVRQNTNIDVAPEYTWVDLASDDIFNYPFLFMTGHGNVSFSETEAKRLRAYCDAGGFLYVDDDYGLDTSIRRELKKVFPEQDLQELPFSHG